MEKDFEYIIEDGSIYKKSENSKLFHGDIRRLVVKNYKNFIELKKGELFSIQISSEIWNVTAFDYMLEQDMNCDIYMIVNQEKNKISCVNGAIIVDFSSDEIGKYTFQFDNIEFGLTTQVNFNVT